MSIEEYNRATKNLAGPLWAVPYQESVCNLLQSLILHWNKTFITSMYSFCQVRLFHVGKPDKALITETLPQISHGDCMIYILIRSHSSKIQKLIRTGLLTAAAGIMDLDSVTLCLHCGLLLIFPVSLNTWLSCCDKKNRQTSCEKTMDPYTGPATQPSREFIFKRTWQLFAR